MLRAAVAMRPRAESNAERIISRSSSRPEGPIETVVAVGFRPETLEQIWEEVETVRSVELQDVNPWSTPFHVAICRRPRVPLRDLWARNRPW